jgi:predicted membrane channel-forming protein YqfA (hemolysin III family)
MHLGKILRIAAYLLLVCLILWVANGLFYLFDHPTFPGEAAIAITGLVLLVAVTLWLSIRPVHWLLHVLFARHDHQGDR